MAYVSIIVDQPFTIGRETKRAVNSIPLGRRGQKPEILGTTIKTGTLYAIRVAEELVRKGKEFRATLMDPKSRRGDQDITLKLQAKARKNVESEKADGENGVVFEAAQVQALEALPQEDVVFPSKIDGVMQFDSPFEQDYHRNLALFGEETAIPLHDALSRVADAVNYAGMKKGAEKIQPWDLVKFIRDENSEGSVVASLDGIERAHLPVFVGIRDYVRAFVDGTDLRYAEVWLNDRIANLMVNGAALGAVYSLALPRLGLNKTSTILQ